MTSDQEEAIRLRFDDFVASIESELGPVHRFVFFVEFKTAGRYERYRNVAGMAFSKIVQAIPRI